MSDLTQEEKHAALFVSLVFLFQSAAMQHIGKVKNPVTDKIERDLAQAQTAIDLLDMIAEKTKGNLTESETKLLRDVSRELKLNYVDELEKEKSQPKGQS